MRVALRISQGADLIAALADVAALRIAVFREWPYLYDGSLDYELDYLQIYRDSADAVLIGAYDGARLVGAATGTPLTDHADDFAAAFAGYPVPVGDIFYCAESVLLPHYRGQGIGHGFFELREAHARAIGKSHVAFCAVQRPHDHPARPMDYRPLDAFWRARGYGPADGVIARFDWKDLGDAAQSSKQMQFWIKAL